MYFDRIEISDQNVCFIRQNIKSFNLAKKDALFSENKVYVRKILEGKKPVVLSWKLIKNKSQNFYSAEKVSDELNFKLSRIFDETIFN